MKKISLKILSYFSLLLAFVIFVLLFLTFFLVNSSNFSSLIYSIILVVASVVITLLVIIFLIVLDPTMQQLISALRPIFRFESLSHPLLLKMAYNAPGTFHHAINVSILAQKAAKSIGADALLVRVAAYYHDLGKIEHPIKFIENQAGTEIPRSEDAKSIRTNAQIIINHVKSGVVLAQKNKLPIEVIDLIKQHHGTTRVLYFYEKAKERGLKIKQTDFRYDGPAPESREAAILMLADSVEAATRSIPNLTAETIETITSNTIADRLAEQQFDAVKFEDGDLDKIKLSLNETLRAIYHQRIIFQNEEN
ncbi:MAG: HDIG domain-containing protein [Candidatus Berkelbacteria bacterium]|nr:HDIG domain-containing protein [Candidatus Berkelbacteria bacterium]